MALITWPQNTGLPAARAVGTASTTKETFLGFKK